MADKKDFNVNFRIDSEFAEWFGQYALRLNAASSKIIRASLILAAPQLEAMPDLLDISLKDLRK